MEKFLISIIVPFHNEEKYIADAINSLLNQTYSNIEIILINDHSTDNSPKVCNEFIDTRIKYYDKIDLPQGEASSRNFGIEISNGDFITFLDADDICSKDRIAFQLDKIIELGIDSTVCGCWVIKKGLENSLMKMPSSNEEIIKGFDRSVNRTTIVGATIMGHRDIFLKFKYRLKFKYFTDWDLLARMHESRLIKFANVAQPLYTYNIRAKGTKYQKDWLDFNIFMRNSQELRRKNLKEYESPMQMFSDLRKNNKTKYFRYKLLQELIKLKRFLIKR
jgi:glycosyltransferase involved in cell wall biosynthesis